MTGAKGILGIGAAALALALLLGAGHASASPEPGESGWRRRAEPSAGDGFFALRPDQRRCAAPLCGGYFARLVNRGETRCADGRARAECYVAELDLRALGLQERDAQELRARPQEFLIHGRIARLGDRDVPQLGRLEVREALRGHAGSAPSGRFYVVRDLGIRCVRFPCLSLAALELNAQRPELRIAQLDLGAVRADPADGEAQLSTAAGLVVAARSTRVSGPGGSAAALAASEFYTPFPQQRACGSRGLAGCGDDEYCAFPAGADCGAADRPGVCMPRPTRCAVPDGRDPVCGCDGEQYANVCAAAAAGTGIDADGQCALRECGGIRGLGCEDDEFCDLGAGRCGAADLVGVCRIRPLLCTRQFDPVCGCDGQTYGNLCTAQAAGAQLQGPGRCEDR